MKKIFQIGVLILLLISLPLQAHAATVTSCKEALVTGMETVMGVEKTSLDGYSQRLSNLLSTNVETYLLIDEVETLVRDARLELKGICREVQFFEKISPSYVEAYGLSACKTMRSSETKDSLSVITFCHEKSEAYLNAFLEELRMYLLKQAIRTSLEPVVVQLRSLNARLSSLVNEYARLINNFFLFSFRLGDTIIGEHD